MDIKLKHRIIGAVVIVALVVIFVPMLFSKHHQMNSASLQKQPEAPAVPQVNANSQPQVVTPGDNAAATDQASNQPPMTSDSSAATDQSDTMQSVQPNQPVQQTVNHPAAPAVEAVTNQPQISEGVVVSKPSMTLSPETVTPAPTTQPQNVQPQASNSTVTTPAVTVPTPSKPVVKKETKPLTTSLKKWHFNKAHLVKKASVPTKKAFSHTSAKKRLAIAKAAHQAWIVQVGSFAGKDHAQTLISQLRKKGFTAFGYPTKVNNEVITRVCVGPAVTQEKAKALQNKLQKAAHMKGIVVKFDASKLS